MAESKPCGSRVPVQGGLKTREGGTRPGTPASSSAAGHLLFLQASREAAPQDWGLCFLLKSLLKSRSFSKISTLNQIQSSCLLRDGLILSWSPAGSWWQTLAPPRFLVGSVSEKDQLVTSPPFQACGPKNSRRVRFWLPSRQQMSFNSEHHLTVFSL